jgi:hypothetical protein
MSEQSLPKNERYNAEQRKLLETQKLELERAGITKKYLSSLEEFAAAFEATEGPNPNTDGMREAAQSGQLPIAGVNRMELDDEDESEDEELILVTEDPRYGHFDYFSKIEVGEIIAGQVIHAHSPFTEDDVKMLEKHVKQQEAFGIDDIEMP